MTVSLPQRYLFIGDSVTDCDRLVTPDGLGNGYVRFISDGLRSDARQITVLNRGISGNRVGDLRARWKEDCLDLQPSLVSILVGINDTWRRYDSGDPVELRDFERDYRSLLEPLDRVDLFLVEPFLLPISDDQREWREDLDPKIETVRDLAAEFGATLVRADLCLNAYAENLGVDALAPDGVHPTPRGHELLAAEWQEARLSVR
jgi:lysophospholipase L1-like esterase